MGAITKVRVRDVHGRYDEKEVTLYNTETVSQVGQLALGFIEKWGMVAGIGDGEDSAGRHRLRLATVDEVVGRAFDMAEAAWRAAHVRGHIVRLPDLNEVNAEQDARRAAEAAREAERKAAREAAEQS